MSNSNAIVKMLVIGYTPKQFNNIETKLKGRHVEIKLHGDGGINSDYDIYLVGDRNGIKILDAIKEIRKKDQYASIFIFSGKSNIETLKSLINYEITLFSDGDDDINEDDDDCGRVLKSIADHTVNIFNTKTKMYDLSEKVNILNGKLSALCS